MRSPLRIARQLAYKKSRRYNTFFIAREHTQAEYRWIEMFGHGKRMNMPWWGGFDPRAWDVASLMDFAVPVVACLLVWLLVYRG
ncbi:TPA: hypothetical protein ACH9JM_004450 [Escherichia coli]